MASKEKDAKVEAAMMEAAKELGLKLTVNGSIYILDKKVKLDPDPEEEANKLMTKCGGAPVSLDKECAVGGTKGPEGAKGEIPALGDKIPGTPWTLGHFITGASPGSCGQYSQAVSYKEAKQQTEQAHKSNNPGHIDNLIYTAQELKKLVDAMGWGNIKINSAYRSPGHNTCIRGSANSSHPMGFAVDIVVGDRSSHKRDFMKLLELVKDKKVCTNQIIWETNKNGSGPKMGILHIDFKPTGAGRMTMAESVGGKGPFADVKSKEEVENKATQWGIK